MFNGGGPGGGAGTLIIGMVDWSNILHTSCVSHKTFEFQAKMEKWVLRFHQHDVG